MAAKKKSTKRSFVVRLTLIDPEGYGVRRAIEVRAADHVGAVTAARAVATKAGFEVVGVTAVTARKEPS